MISWITIQTLKMNKFQLYDISQKVFKLSIALCILGFLFSMMRWSYASPIFFIGQLFLVISFFGQFFTLPNHTTLHYIGAVLAIVVILGLVSSYIPYVYAVGKYSRVALLGLIGFEFVNMFQSKEVAEKPNLDNDYEFGKEDFDLDTNWPEKSEERNFKLSNLFLTVGILPALIGLVFKMQHYPGATLLLIVGFALGTIGLFLRFFKR